MDNHENAQDLSSLETLFDLWQAHAQLMKVINNLKDMRRDEIVPDVTFDWPGISIWTSLEDVRIDKDLCLQILDLCISYYTDKLSSTTLLLGLCERLVAKEIGEDKIQEAAQNIPLKSMIGHIKKGPF